MGELLVFGQRDMSFFANPFSVAGFALPFAGGDGIGAPMQEEAKASLFPPLHSLVFLLLCLLGRNGEGEGGEGRQ